MRTSARLEAKRAAEEAKNAAEVEAQQLVESKKPTRGTKAPKRKAADAAKPVKARKQNAKQVSSQIIFDRFPSEIILNVATRLDIISVHYLALSCKSLDAAMSDEFWRDLARVVKIDMFIPEEANPRAYVLMRTCVNCGGDLEDAGCHLCSSSRISITRIKSEFGLNDNDLSGLSCHYAQNPHYSNAAPMRLYRVDDIHLAFRRKHKMPFADYKHAKDEKKRLAAERKNARRVVLKEKLETALAAKGLALRNDSQRCEDYMSGSKALTLEEVVDTMMDMHFAHEHGQLSSKQDNAYEEFVSSLDGMRLPRYEFKDEWDSIKDSVLEDCLDRVKRVLNEYRTHRELYADADAEVRDCECGNPKFKNALRMRLNKVALARKKGNTLKAGPSCDNGPVATVKTLNAVQEFAVPFPNASQKTPEPITSNAAQKTDVPIHHAAMDGVEQTAPISNGD